MLVPVLLLVLERKRTRGGARARGRAGSADGMLLEQSPRTRRKLRQVAWIRYLRLPVVRTALPRESIIAHWFSFFNAVSFQIMMGAPVMVYVNFLGVFTPPAARTC